jgi:hypothetical protein
MSAIARDNESLFLHRINVFGDPARNQPYGYAYGRGGHGFLFLNNDHFASRRIELSLDSSIGLDAATGTTLRVVSHFPEETSLRRPDNEPFKFGDTLDLWLRPFEVLMLEIDGGARDKNLPVRSISYQQAASLGVPLPLQTAPHDARLDIQFADAAAFRAKGLKPATQSLAATLPSFGDDPAILAVVVRLRRGDDEWRYVPAVEQIVQPILRIDGENAQMVPVPDGRQYGNTQSFGCSWVVYKIRLPKRWSGKPLQLAVHDWLPAGVEAKTEAWVVKHWWEDESRPVADGYYTYDVP